MTNNRQETASMNRQVVTDVEALAFQTSLDSFINQSLSNARVRGPLRLYHNVLLDWFKRFRILPGRAVVVLLDGRLEDVLYEGSHHALSFPLEKRVDLYVVDTQEHTLEVRTSQELVVFYHPSEKGEPFPVPVDLNVAVTYQIVNPSRVALDLPDPITKLHTAVIESMASVAAQTPYHDFLVSGMLGAAIAQQLQSRDLTSYLGIQVLMVQVINRHGADTLDRLRIDDYIIGATKRRERHEWVLWEQTRIQNELMDAAHRRDIARLIDLTPAYVTKFMPELYPLMFGNREHLDHQRLDVLVQLISGGLLPAPAQQAILSMLGVDLQASAATAPAQQLGVASPSTSTAHAQIAQEVATLGHHGIQATMSRDQDLVYVQAQLRDTRTVLEIFFACANDYPAQPPRMWLTVDGAQQSFTPHALQQWNTQQSLKTLIDAARIAFLSA